jgi:SEC-C motif-containing protein
MAELTCPCGSGKAYAQCCARYIGGGESAPTAEALMRSRYSAYALGHEPYLLATWHATTRPAELRLSEEKGKWFKLEVKRAQEPEKDRAIVEFVARYKLGGRAHRLHETSHFVREDGKWFYVDGEIN